MYIGTREMISVHIFEKLIDKFSNGTVLKPLLNIDLYVCICLDTRNYYGNLLKYKQTYILLHIYLPDKQRGQLFQAL